MITILQDFQSLANLLSTKMICFIGSLLTVLIYFLASVNYCVSASVGVISSSKVDYGDTVAQNSSCLGELVSMLQH